MYIQPNVTATESEYPDELWVRGILGEILEVPRILLDTGSAATLISNRLYDQLPSSSYTMLSLTSADSFIDAQYNPLPILVKIQIHLKLIEEDQHCGDYIHAYVSERLPHDMLLGRTHMNKFIDSIDLTAGTVQLNTEQELILNVVVTGPNIIPPYVYRQVSVKVSLADAFFDGMGSFYPAMFNKGGDYIPLCVSPFSLEFMASETEVHFQVVIYNPTDTVYALYTDQVIGEIVAYSEEISERTDPDPIDTSDEPIVRAVLAIMPQIEEIIGLDPIEEKSNLRTVFFSGLNVDSKTEERDIDEVSHLKDVSINPKLDMEQRRVIEELLLKFAKVFNQDEFHPPPAKGVFHAIDTGNTIPIKQRNYRYNPHNQDLIDQKVQEYLKHGVIRPSISPWSNPICPVIKPDGTLRMCLDLRKLNAVTKLDSYPLPRIDEVLDSLRDCLYFALIDLSAGYHQIPMKPEDIEKVAFATRGGLWEFVVMPEGVVNGPATFQRYMEKVLIGLVGRIVWVYIDDIIVHGRTWEEFVENLYKVLERLASWGLTAKARKTKIGFKEIKVLGHIVGNGVIKPNPDKVKAIRNYPVPNSQRELRSFIGLVNYYRKFIPNLSTVAEPLFQLLRKNTPYIWTDKHTEILNYIKNKLTTDPVMQCPDFSKPFILETDASTTGLGAILSQEITVTSEVNSDWTAKVIKPVSYISRTLTPAEKNYSVSELECLAIIWAINQFNIYLSHGQFILYTDHKALSWLQQKKSTNRKLTRWALLLSEYNFIIKHRKGTEMKHVDALSRYPIRSVFNITQTKIIPCYRIPYKSINNVTKKDKEWEVQDIIERVVENGKTWYKVLWKGYPESESSWEPEENLKNCAEALADYERRLELRRNEIVNEAKVHSDIITIPSPIVPEHLELPLEQQLSSEYFDSKTMEIIKAQRKDPDLIPLFDYIEKHTLPIGDGVYRAKIISACRFFTVDDSNSGLYRIQIDNTQYRPLQPIKRLVIPREFVPFILKHYHDSVFAGHLGLERTYKRIANTFYWKRMWTDVEQYIKACPICQTLKAQHSKYKFPVGTVPVPSSPFEFLAVDFMGPLYPPSNGFSNILVFMDYFSKWAIVIPTKDQEASTVAKALVESVICMFGAPAKLLSDRGAAFMSNLVAELLIWLDIKKVNTTAYHPQTNGMVERFNQTLISILRTITDVREGTWAEYLPAATFAYNSSIQHTLQESPYSILFGREPKFPGPDILTADPNTFDSTTDYIGQLQEQLSFSWKVVKERITEAQAKYLAKNKTFRSISVFKPGDLVWFRKQLKPRTGISAKFQTGWTGPYIIVAVKSPINYVIQSLATIKTTPVKSHLVHVSRLKMVHTKEGNLLDVEQPIEELPNLVNQPLIDDVVEELEPPDITTTTVNTISINETNQSLPSTINASVNTVIPNTISIRVSDMHPERSERLNKRTSSPDMLSIAKRTRSTL
jgi:hypothetical protein